METILDMLKAVNICDWCGESYERTFSQGGVCSEYEIPRLPNGWQDREIMMLIEADLNYQFKRADTCNDCLAIAEETEVRAQQAGEIAREAAHRKIWEQKARQLDAVKKKSLLALGEQRHCPKCHKLTPHGQLSAYKGKPLVCIDCGFTDFKDSKEAT
jgi:hypothetical protein